MPDKKNSSHSIAALAQGGLGLPDRDYYLSEEKDRVETREKYRAHPQPPQYWNFSPGASRRPHSGRPQWHTYAAAAGFGPRP